MFTEFYCPDGYINPDGMHPEERGQFFIVVATPLEVIDLTTRVKFDNYALAKWFENYTIGIRSSSHDGFNANLQLGRYKPDQTVLAITPDGKSVSILPPFALSEFQSDYYLPKRLSIPYFDIFTDELKSLKQQYKLVLEQYPYIEPFKARASNVRLPKRLELFRLGLQFDMMSIPNRIEEAFQMPKGVTDDDLTMAYFVVKFFESARRDLPFSNIEPGLPFKNDDIIVSEFKYRVKNKLSFNGRFYPLDSVKSGEIEKRVTRSVKNIQKFNSLYGEQHLRAKVATLSDDELCEAMLTAYLADRYIGYLSHAFKFMIIEIQDRIAGRGSI